MRLRRSLLRLLFGARLPVTEGELRVAGLRGSLLIRRDRYAIPYVEAGHEEDAWFGLGFCQAQDRAFQLEMRLRMVRGTLSALFGRKTLALDQLSRRIGFREAAERQLPVLDAAARAQVAAFVRGLNAGLAAGPRPLELALLRSRPTLWQPADVLGVGKLMSFVLIGNWDVELARLKLLLADGPQALRDLDPAYDADHLVTAPPGTQAGAAVDALSEDLEAFLAFAGSALGAVAGSNAWAVAGQRAACGRPILANDPHLSAGLPSHWYLARLSAPGWSAAGASLVGVPAVNVGHNGFAAWGVTAGLIDQVDLFLEELGPDGRSVRRGAAFQPCLVRREVIEIRGQPPVVEEVVVTPRGPIITPALAGGLPALSLRAVWLDARPVAGVISAHRARSFEAFRAHFAAWPFAGQNVVYADAAGRIGWFLCGEAPRRRKGRGTLPLPAADPDTGWEEEFVPFEEMPYLADPPQGFVASANNQPLPAGQGPFLGVDWLDGYRVSRISEALAARSDWTLEETLRLQLDETTPAWQQVREAVLAVPAATPEARQALELLRDWDGVVSAGSSAAAVFQLFLADLWRRVAQARAPNAWQWALSRGFDPLLGDTTFAIARPSRLLGRLLEQPAGWLPRPWPQEMAESLAAAVRGLRSRFGRDPRRWAWGRVRPLLLSHPLGRLPIVGAVFNRGPFPWGGDSTTVSQAGTAPLAPLAGPSAIASLRFAVQAGDWDGARFVLPGGQSGNPFLPHYDDMLALWLRGEGVPIAWSEGAIAAATRAVLRLRPL